MNKPSKSTLAAAALLVITGGLAMSPAASAQQAPQAGNAAPPPAAFKSILNDEHVGLIVSTFAPGITVPMRNYPRRTLYVLKGPANMTFAHADGRTEVVPPQETGSVRSAPPGQMAITHVGTSDAVMLVVIDKRDLPSAK